MPRRVVLVIADGLRADVVEPGTMPSLYSLGWENTRAREAVTVCPSNTVAALASLATGVHPDTHGFKQPKKPNLKRLSGQKPFPRELAAARIPTMITSGEMPPGKRAISMALSSAAGIGSLKLTGQKARGTAAATLKMFEDFTRGFAMIHLKDCDCAGHANGWMSDAYLEAAAEVDAAIGMIAADTEHDLLIVTADHGGGGVVPNDHGEYHPDNERIPLVMAGWGVAHNRIIPDRVSIVDIPATMLWSFGLPIPKSYEGRVLMEAFARRKEAVGLAQ